MEPSQFDYYVVRQNNEQFGYYAAESRKAIVGLISFLGIADITRTGTLEKISECEARHTPHFMDLANRPLLVHSRLGAFPLGTVSNEIFPKDSMELDNHQAKEFADILSSFYDGAVLISSREYEKGIESLDKILAITYNIREKNPGDLFMLRELDKLMLATKGYQLRAHLGTKFTHPEKEKLVEQKLVKIARGKPIPANPYLQEIMDAYTWYYLTLFEV